ncbi:hypothetical protein EST38_g2240 [Candolleomyces aberdarensis]|uniref:Uncharacterized protein n=1 Tax=Candolleomyces aberdarensis TaxID=2316362 RepID=A0A4Q2DU15_9AGAR|nr:hypothetical protein EST38_g2240 [Candolleomyces aberdarensis]
MAEDIRYKGVTKNSNTNVGEGFHRSLKHTFFHHSNFKDVDDQLAQYALWHHVRVIIQNSIENAKITAQEAQLLVDALDRDELSTISDILEPRKNENKFGHIVLGAPQKLRTIEELVGEIYPNDNQYASLEQLVATFLNVTTPLGPKKQPRRPQPVIEPGSGEEFDSPSSGSETDELSSLSSASDSSNAGVATRRSHKHAGTNTTKAMQLALDEALKENRKLKLERAELKRKAKEEKEKQSRTAGSKPKGLSSQLMTDDERIALLGRRFFIMNEAFVPVETFIFDSEITQIDVTDPARYENNDNAVAVLQREIYESTPEGLQDMLKGTTRFRDIVRPLLYFSLCFVADIHVVSRKGERAFKARSYAKNTDRSSMKECSAMFKKPGSRKFSKYAPVIFPEGKEDMNKIFWVLHLALMLKSALFGRTSIEFDAHGKTSKSKGAPPVGILWGIKEVTPGIVALIAVVAVFLHSPDTEFSIQGNKTEIDYQHLFRFYKKIILRGFQDTPAKRKQYSEMFCWYNTIVFSDRAPAFLIALPDDENDDKSSDDERAFCTTGGGDGAQENEEVEDWDMIPNEWGYDSNNTHSDGNHRADEHSLPLNSTQPAILADQLQPQAEIHNLTGPSVGQASSKIRKSKPTKAKQKVSKGKQRAPADARSSKTDQQGSRLARELARLDISEQPGPDSNNAGPSTRRRSKRVTKTT